MTNPTGMISALALQYTQQLQSQPERAGGVQDDPVHCLNDDDAVTDKCRRKAHPKTPPEMLDALAYSPAQAAKVVGRSYTRIKKAIREKELTARKDGRATLIERAELQRWLDTLPTIGRKPEQEPAHVAARGSVGGRHKQAPARSTPPRGPRSLAMSNALEEALEDNPRR